MGGPSLAHQHMRDGLRSTSSLLPFGKEEEEEANVFPPKKSYFLCVSVVT